MDELDGRQESFEAEDNKRDDKEPSEDGESKFNKRKSKRTKTGCLTCRRRRIKCGEERPTCQNCTKSKRQCEGYNQRVVFKDPLSAYRGPPFSGASSFSYAPETFVTASTSHHGQPHQQTSSGPAPLLTIAPKPSSDFMALSSNVIPPYPLPLQTCGDTERMAYIEGSTQGFQAEETYPRSGDNHHSDFEGNADTVDRSHLPMINEPQCQASHYDFNALHRVETAGNLSSETPQLSPLHWSSGPSRASMSSSQELFYDSNRPWSTASTVFHTSYQSSSTWPSDHARDAPSNLPEASILRTKKDYPVTGTTQGALPISLEQKNQRDKAQLQNEHRQRTSTDFTMSTTAWQSTRTSISSGNAPQYYPIEDDDDLYDVGSEDEVMEDDTAEADYGAIQERHLKNNDLGIMVALQARQDTQEIALRSYTSFIDRANMLATYTPSARSSPLRDAMTARIFCHFINVTGPSLSMFERHPANASLVFQGRPVPKSQQHIWSYTFPILALENQALLHAMLAVASLHIAKLQNGPITSSLKHYAIALRRIAKSVSLPARRGQPATLAATMLLGIYDCWCADHQKWSNHLLGAKQLVREIDFVNISKYIKVTKAQQRQLREQEMRRQQERYANEFLDDRSRNQSSEEDVDENIIGVLTGKRLRYDEHGRIIDDNPNDNAGTKVYKQTELDIYENQRDLFWWYCKQDVYQSLLGGGKLYMDYTLWGDCPPRAPLGRLNAIYGTFDHLILLMGRVADFAAKDLKRKKKLVAVNGGWRPPGRNHQTPQASSQQSSSNGSGSHPQNGMRCATRAIPSFAGMMPNTYEAKLPMGFTSSGEPSPESTRSDETDSEALMALTLDAEEEWQEIRSAFTMLEDNFGRDFQALGPEYSTPIQTPFGTALNYRTYSIAGIWLNYYMGLIVCHRAHPSMPPAAMMAAGCAARQTAQYAKEIGRIAAGIAPEINSKTIQVNPLVGSAIIEASLPLFFAAVQYQDAAQRAWTIGRLQDTSRLTGWQSAQAIQQGCESSWVKVAEMGKGPPYTRTMNDPENRSTHSPSTLSTSRRIDRAVADNPEREHRLVVARTDRAHYALGLIGVPEDFSRLDLVDDDDDDDDEISKYSNERFLSIVHRQKVGN